MKYQRIVKAKFIERQNRFVAKAEVGDETVTVHVKNTGRCKELLVPGATVFLEDFEDRMGSRKMRYSLVAVEKQIGSSDTLLINMDSQAPNKVVYETLKSGDLRLPGFGISESHVKTSEAYSLIKPEAAFGNSRFDFYVESGEQRAFIEVKGVTLENDGFARFPDAPTERGFKHIEELTKAANEGYGAYVLFVIQMKKIHTFGPNYETQPEFGWALQKAEQKGVRILAYDCIVTEDTLVLDKPVMIDLSRPAD